MKRLAFLFFFTVASSQFLKTTRVDATEGKNTRQRGVGRVSIMSALTDAFPFSGNDARLVLALGLRNGLAVDLCAPSGFPGRDLSYTAPPRDY